MEKVRCRNAFTTFINKCYADAASRKRSHEESEGGPAIKKPAGDSHGEALTCILHSCIHNYD